MKFGEYLRMHLTSEWSSQYISYAEMKDMLADIIDTIPLIYQSREEYFLSASEEFLQFCEREASKINTFYTEKLAEALLRLDFLKNELECIQKTNESRRFTLSNIFNRRRNTQSTEESVNIINIDENERRTKPWVEYIKLNPLKKKTEQRGIKRQRYRKLTDLKLAFSEFYLMLILLKNYQALNYTGFCKILEKHDKFFQTTRGYQWRLSYIDSTTFYKSKRVDQLIDEVESLFTTFLESGDRTRAMERLRVPPLEEKQPRIVTFRLGISIGMLCVLIPLLFLVGTVLFGPSSSKTLNWRSGLHLYRSSFFIIIYLILFGLNVYGWSKYGVNHVLIFEMNPRKHLTYQKYLEIGTFLLVTWILSVLLFLMSYYYDRDPFIHPIGYIFFLILFLINPIKIFYRQSRYWLIKKLCRVITSPFHHVGFCDFWIGDQLCSLDTIFLDIEYFICFYLNGSNFSTIDSNVTLVCSTGSEIILQIIFQNLPSWYRFVQCLRRYRDTKQKFPHLFNAGKYASGFFAVLTNGLRRMKIFDYQNKKSLNPFVYLWILTSLINSTYKLIWDIKMDCGFFSSNSSENKYLHEQLIYPYKTVYYLSILLNIIFRYIWIINIFIHFYSLFADYSDLIGFILALIEIFRRFIWNYYRLENEHLNNCGQFRAVRDISIRPTPLLRDSSLAEYHQRSRTTGIEMPSTFDMSQSILRRKTNAEDFIDEIDPVLSLQSN